MTLPRQWEKHALALVEQASPLEAELFRSVELDYAHPDDVTSGEGTRLYGGRFVKPGVRAVYGSVDEETSFKESTARLHRLGGRNATRFIGYPRITYVIVVQTPTHIALTTMSADAAAILPACLNARDLAPSQDVGEYFRGRGIQSIGYPSAIPEIDGRNIAVFRDVDPPPVVALKNREQIVEALRRLAQRMQE